MFYIKANITKEEYKELKDEFGDKIEPILDFEEEVCRQELDVHLSNYNYEHNIEMSKESFNNIIEQYIYDVTDKARDEIFSELSDMVYEVIEEHFE